MHSAVPESAMTETYPLDIDPEQTVRWLRAEQEAAPSALRVTARRKSEVREIPVKRETHLGDAERQDLSEVATVATLEIAPAHAADGWLVTITVEDELGPHLLDEGRASEGEQAIDLGTFYSEYIRRGRGSATVSAEVENFAAKARLDYLIKAIETNRHEKLRNIS
jgi:hypothetical protein